MVKTPAPKTVPCPRCGDPVVWGDESPFRPFCSERCRLIDLGGWFDESYRIPDHSEAPGDDATGTSAPCVDEEQPH